MEASVRPEGSAEAVLGSKKRIKKDVIASDDFVVKLRLRSRCSGMVVEE